jgi:hypothetical protein
MSSYLCLHHQSASAVTLTAVLNPNQDSTHATYEELHTLLVDYPPSGQIANYFKSSPDTSIVIRAATSSSLPSPQSGNSNKNALALQNLLSNINTELTNLKSTVTATSISINFTGDIKTYSNTESVVDQRMFIDIGFENYMIPNNQDPTHKYVDFNWRAFSINNPIILSYADNKTGHIKTVDINYMSGLLNAAMPGFMNALKGAGATQVTLSLLEKPLMDYSKLSAPMDKWYVLFDPAASLVETQGYGYKGEQNGARVDTIYSLGEGSIREGKHEETVYDSSFGSGANTYSLKFTIPPPNARVDVLGYSRMTTAAGNDMAVISSTNEGGSSYAGNFPLVVLGSLGGIMGGITALVLFKSRK